MKKAPYYRLTLAETNEVNQDKIALKWQLRSWLLLIGIYILCKHFFAVNNLLLALLFLLFGILINSVYYGVRRIITQRKRLERKKLLLIERENALRVLELQYSKARLPTHFLNNTFMLLRTSLKHDPSKGVEYINLLSDIVQFYELYAQDGLIPIEDELAQLNRYVSIHSMRCNRNVFLDIERKGDLSDVEIIPMMILTLAENMYKYGIVHVEAKPAKIFIRVKEDQLFMRFTNWINLPDHTRSASGFGLKDIQTSLKVFYPDRHSFKAEKIEGRYVVEIAIHR